MKSAIELDRQHHEAPDIRPLRSALEGARAKIREDLFRFRTCCADPRASK